MTPSGRPRRPARPLRPRQRAPLSHVTNAYDVSGSDEVVVFYVVNGKITQQWVVWDELE